MLTAVNEGISVLSPMLARAVSHVSCGAASAKLHCARNVFYSLNQTSARAGPSFKRRKIAEMDSTVIPDWMGLLQLGRYVIVANCVPFANDNE